MKQYSMSFSNSTEHTPEHAERTAKRNASGSSFDVIFQVWPNRQSMAKSIRMQQKREHRQTDWRACVPLSDGEGF